MASNESEQPETQKKDVTNAEIQAAVDKLLSEISNNFAGVSSDIYGKLDEMCRRLDKLEADVKKETGKDDPPSQP